jgi:hypothetical protein
MPRPTPSRLACFCFLQPPVAGSNRVRQGLKISTTGKTKRHNRKSESENVTILHWILIKRMSKIYIDKISRILVVVARMAEWSKALDLGSNLSGGAGSNPASCMGFLNQFSVQNILIKNWG